MSYGMTFEELDAYVKGGGSKGYAKLNGSTPSFVTFVSFNKKQATVLAGQRNHIVPLTHIRPVNGFRHRPEAMVIKPHVQQEFSQMSADKAPRPIGHKIGTPGAAPAKAPEELVDPTSPNSYANRIVVTAAKIEAHAAIVVELKKDFEKTEADFVAMKELRDEQLQKLRTVEKEFDEMRTMLNQAIAALLTGAPR